LSKSIHEILDELRDAALDQRDKGDLFEKLTKRWLEVDPVYRDFFQKVWLYGEWAEEVGVGKNDVGIDLVARESETGDLWAIQCKFYASDAYLDKKEIDSFFTASGKEPFRGRIIFSTTDNWSKNAEEALENQQIPVTRIRVQDLDDSSVDWSSFSLSKVYELELKDKKTPFKHQEEALEDALKHFKGNDRGKLIMACGTGKTFTSLQIAEKMVPAGGTMLFLVPSIALLSQTLKEWKRESRRPIRAYAVCSDSKVGKRKEDEDLQVPDLAYPATTNTKKLASHFADNTHVGDGFTVIFSTYQSIDVVAKAQSEGVPEFDLTICDEAHRTTGVTLSGEDESSFQRVHKNEFIRSKKRMYMTATPRIFMEQTKQKALDVDAEVSSMDDPTRYGEEFHRLNFGLAVEKGLLSDYKVLVLAVSEKHVSRQLQKLLTKDGELNLDDATKIVGCYNGLRKRSGNQDDFIIDKAPMKTAVAFARTIKDSMRLADLFEKVTTSLNQVEGEKNAVKAEAEHVDGKFNVLARNAKLDWLKEKTPGNTVRILSNARCLSEGVDVPALDAVLFLNPRDSQVDVVQSVGRVMRKAPGKSYGYVILPITVPSDKTAEEALNDNKNYRVVWQVLQALRSHDERFNAMVNKIELNKDTDERVKIIGVGGDSDGDGTAQMDVQDSSLMLDFDLGEWKDAILAKIVDKVGERTYWERWAQDVAEIAERFIVRINTLVDSSDPKVMKSFTKFLKGLQDNLNPSITRAEAIEMLAQHMVTKPVFDALFAGYKFTDQNPVSKVMEAMLVTLEAHNLERESDSLVKFYDSVRTRASDINSAEGRQVIIKELYERFFRIAFPNTADRLGIVYTPTEIVDFIIQSTEQALKDEFGVSISDKGIHVLDPFTGTGTFIVRLLQLGLIRPEDLENKFRYELHANELVLLAYYVAAINIEETFHSASGKYLPFDGIVLTDTFQMSEGADSLDLAGTFQENNERVVKQNELDIRVIIGNPPYSIGQGRQNDDNQNMKYQDLDEKIASTYVALTTAHAKNSLFDQYIRAFRWATDRIGTRGVICFVSNGGWLDSNSADGFRKTLSKEFSSIQVLNLRGNIRKFDKTEGENIFGSGSMTPITVTLLIKNPESTGPCKIRYVDIGESLSRDQKLEIVGTAGKIQELQGLDITENVHGDWINQRSEAFLKFYPMGAKTAKGKSPEGFFTTYTGGIKTNRDAWAYNFDANALKINMANMIDFYNSQLGKSKVDNDPNSISWDSTLLGSHRANKKGVFNPQAVRKAVYRPFVKTNLYFDRMFNNSVNRFPALLPEDGKNLFIVVPGPSDGHSPSVFITDSLVDIMPYGGVQCFPLYDLQEGGDDSPNSLFDIEASSRYALSDFIVDEFKKTYGKAVTPEDIFYYVFAVLSSREYQTRFTPELKKLLPRIPFVKDFKSFSKLGRALADVQLGYEGATPFKLEEEWSNKGKDDSSNYKVEKLTFGKGRDKSRIIVNKHLTLSGIPLEAYEFKVQGKSAIEWVMSRYVAKNDKDSNLLNDPNKFSQDPKYIVETLKKVITTSMESLKIIKSLPKLEIID
jgi:predicted helicase